MKFLTAFLLLIQFVAHGQYTHGPYVLRGVVRDSVMNDPLPGVNVVILSQNRSTVTDSEGRFQIESSDAAASVSFSFIGFITKTRVVPAADTAVILLSYDEQELLETDRYIKTTLSAGYYGDITEAPAGFIANWKLQSIGNTRIGTSTSFKYWRQRHNEGIDALLSKQIRVPYFPPGEIILGYKKIDYGDESFNLRQTRLLLSYHAIYFITVDAGGGYNTLNLFGAERPIDKEKYFSGIVGVSKVFRGSSLIGHGGIRASVDHGADHLFYEAGFYKSIYIPKIPAMTIMARYYNYDTFDGVMISLRINLFSTEYYCCESWVVHSDDLAALR